VIPTCRHAWTVPIPDCSNCQYLDSTSNCRFLPQRPTATPSPKSSSVATSPRTQVPPGGQFSAAVDSKPPRNPRVVCASGTLTCCDLGRASATRTIEELNVHTYLENEVMYHELRKLIPC